MLRPTPDALRQEARILYRTAERVRCEGEELIARATALKQAARALEEHAADLEDVARIQRLAGGPVQVRRSKESRVA
jgi:DNA polymerase/3'-5' exonuclease PolX